jgi:vancomycin resistance protein VanJ
MATVSPWVDRSNASAPARPRFQNPKVLRRRYKWWTFTLSSLNLLAVACLVIACLQFSENWWLSGALIYLPQTPFLIPPVCLLGCSLIWHIRSALLNLTSIGLILVCLCGGRFSMKAFNEVPDSGHNVRLITCNVQDFKPNFGQVLREISRFKPDVLVLQEARHVPDMLQEYLAGWNWQHQSGLMVGSRWRLSEGKLCHTSPYDRNTAMTVRIEAPSGTILLGDVHLMTARRGLTDLSVTSILDGSGPASVEHHAFLRDEEARQTQTFLAGLTDDTPVIVAGDFNMPTTSSIFDYSFGQYSDAFDEAGAGFGYTAPCRPVRFWLPKVPWLRIDHILASSHFETLRCEAGELNGSDHRLVAAVLQLRDQHAPPR